MVESRADNEAERASPPKPKRIRSKRSRPRKLTISPKRITRRELRDEHQKLGDDVVELANDRPIVRESCRDAIRPCPWVGCKHNLYLDVNPETGSITLNFPELEPFEMPSERSCVLDAAERGGLTLEEVGTYINLTRERIRQVEVKAFLRLKGDVRGLGVDGPVAPGCASTEPCGDGEANLI